MSINFYPVAINTRLLSLRFFPAGTDHILEIATANCTADATGAPAYVQTGATRHTLGSDAIFQLQGTPDIVTVASIVTVMCGMEAYDAASILPLGAHYPFGRTGLAYPPDHPNAGQVNRAIKFHYHRVAGANPAFLEWSGRQNGSEGKWRQSNINPAVAIEIRVPSEAPQTGSLVFNPAPGSVPPLPLQLPI